MNREERHDRLRALTAEAARTRGRLPADEAGRAPAAGDLYVLPQAAAFPVEWALLETEPGRPHLWLAVPADTNPLYGPGDVRVGREEPGGPLGLRCRHAVRLPQALVEGGHRTASLSADVTARALAACRAVERGELGADPLAEEVGADLEYRDWERDVLAPARASALSAPETTAGRGSKIVPARSRPLLALAATLALTAVGLGVWSWQLRQQVRDLSEPLLIGGSQEVVMGTDVRKPVTLRLLPDEERILVFVVLSGEAADHARYRVELRNVEDRILWASSEVARGAVPELNLVIPRRFLDPSEPPLRLVVLSTDGSQDLRVAEAPVKVEGAGSPPEP